MLGAKGVVTDLDQLSPLNVDWTKKYTGKSKLALRPQSTEEMSAIIGYCNERRLAVVPQSGNTGFTGGATPTNDEIIINM